MHYKDWLGQALRPLPKILDCCYQIILEPYFNSHAADHSLKPALSHWLGFLLKNQQPKQHKFINRQLQTFI